MSILEIKLDTVDELFALCSELGAITYLQGLISYDISGNVLLNPELEFAHRRAETYLWDRQLETVLKLRKTLVEEEFSKSSST